MSFEPEKLDKNKYIDLSKVELSFDKFALLAQNQSLTVREKIGFPNGYREGYEKLIIEDIARKLEFDKKTGKTLLDIGSGASPLTSLLLDRMRMFDIQPVLNDSREMLNNIESDQEYTRMEGKFPEVLELQGPSNSKTDNGFDLVL
jgi:hypothetical protein